MTISIDVSDDDKKKSEEDEEGEGIDGSESD